MTIGEWLRSREPQPPAALLARLEEVLGDSLRADFSSATEALLGAGERISATLLVDGSSTRASALELLTADALVTYAFEAAGSGPDCIEQEARGAMSRVAAMVTETRE